MIKYKASDWGWRPQIEAVEILSETNKFVLARFPSRVHCGQFVDRREAKFSENHAYLDNWVEAKAFMQMKCQEQVESCRASLQRAHDRLGNVKGMKPPAQEDAA